MRKITFFLAFIVSLQAMDSPCTLSDSKKSSTITSSSDSCYDTKIFTGLTMRQLSTLHAVFSSSDKPEIKKHLEALKKFMDENKMQSTSAEQIKPDAQQQNNDKSQRDRARSLGSGRSLRRRLPRVKSFRGLGKINKKDQISPRGHKGPRNLFGFFKKTNSKTKE